VKRVAVLSGAFNPVTVAHLALTRAAQSVADEVICVVPRVYPHKELEGATLEQRLEMLNRALGQHKTRTTEKGLFIDIARELRAADPAAEIDFICGRDAAERVLNWDYGDPTFAERMLEEFGLIVAARQGEFNIPAHISHRIRTLPMSVSFDDVSSTEVRRRIVGGEPWEHLAPKEIHSLVREIYRR
jgi:nicotinate (nicotinamide) nucleotide adenylyltransferase